jgi:hypothetical protein
MLYFICNIYIIPYVFASRGLLFGTPWGFGLEYVLHIPLCVVRGDRIGSVMIRVRIDSPHPLVCRKRLLKGAVLRMRPEKTEAPSHSTCGTIKISPCSKTLQVHVCLRSYLRTKKEAGPRRLKIGPIKCAKLNWSFDKLFSAWKIGHIWWFMEMVNIFWIFRHCARDI